MEGEEGDKKEVGEKSEVTRGKRKRRRNIRGKWCVISVVMGRKRKR